MYPSTLTSAALLIAKALDARGLNSRALFFKAGLNPAKLRDASARYPYAGMARLWQLAVEATGDPNFGLEVARYWHPTTLHALGYAWLASSTLRVALERLVRYFHMLTSVARLSIDEQGVLRFDSSAPEPELRPAFADTDAGVALILRMCRVSAGENFRPRKVMLMRPTPSNVKPYLETFGAPVEFSAACDTICFDPASLAVVLPTANAELARVNDQVIQRYLARFDDDDITNRARLKLTELMPSGGITREKLAQSIYLSSKTLQRRLNKQGTTFQKLLDDTRCELALYYMRDPKMSVRAVSYLLGFNEPGNFARAFRRWADYSPSEYRRLSTRAE